MSNMEIPGFTPEQSWVIRTVAREAAREVVAEFSRGKACPFDCEDVANLKVTVYGDGEDGLKSTVTTMKEQVGSLVWWNRAAVTAAFAAATSAVVMLIATDCG